MLFSTRARTLLPIATLLLNGCAAAGSEPAAIVDHATHANPCADLTLKVYSGADSARVADEIQASSPDARWPQMVEDYGALRDEIRACRRAVP